MTKAKRKKQNYIERREWMADVRPETKRSILAIIFFVLAIFFVLSAFGKAGWGGDKLYRLLSFLFGKGFFLLPASLFLAGIAFITSPAVNSTFFAPNIIGIALFLFGSFGLLDFSLGNRFGGFAGVAIAYPFRLMVDRVVGSIITLGIMSSGLLVMFNASLTRKPKQDNGENQPSAISALRASLEKSVASMAQATRGVVEPIKESVKESVKQVSSEKPNEEPEIFKLPKRVAKLLPPLDLLSSREGKPSSGDLKANSNIIKRTLETFGIPVEMADINVGPTVTQYTLKPAEGVKLSKIVALQNDLSLALAAHPIRIEAPIPGKSLVGIEIPNRSAALVGLRSLLEEKEFKSSSPLLFALGRDVSGQAAFADIARMPHLLIAGATGTGKSVALHVLITSLVYRNLPDRLKFIMIDPKRVELAVYNGLPHLLTPVVVEGEKSMKALKWAVAEMENRYKILSEAGARDVFSYNESLIKKNADPANEAEIEPMPFLVIVIDELADLMAAWARDVEASIVRLAQMARAVGIHLIVSTQRPSVEVITGLIKANITSRIALQVASQIDSRTILDTSGAEKLLGNGDMLFMAGDVAKPRRIQGGVIGYDELKRVVGFYKKGEFEAGEVDIFSQVSESARDNTSLDDIDDDMYSEAIEVVQQAGKASASLLQRRLRVGYARAARLLDIMEERGVIGPADGAKPREVYIDGSSPKDGLI